MIRVMIRIYRCIESRHVMSCIMSHRVVAAEHARRILGVRGVEAAKNVQNDDTKT
jgi:hypothetical protein